MMSDHKQAMCQYWYSIQNNFWSNLFHILYEDNCVKKTLTKTEKIVYCKVAKQIEIYVLSRILSTALLVLWHLHSYLAICLNVARLGPVVY